jgi:hypothetical protein
VRVVLVSEYDRRQRARGPFTDGNPEKGLDPRLARAYELAREDASEREYLRAHGNDRLRRFVDFLGKSLKNALNVDVRITPGRYRFGSDIFDAIQVFIAAEGLRRFLINYPRMRKGLLQLRADIVAVIGTVARVFSDREGMDVKSLTIHQPSPLKLEAKIADATHRETRMPPRARRGRTAPHASPPDPRPPARP